MLSRLLNLRQACDEIEARPPALLLNVEGQEVVVIVDQLIGGREIVIKSLGSHLRKVHGVMGATLMGNGEVVLILSLAELVRGTTHSVVRRVPTLKTVSSAPANEKQTANGAEAANHYAYLPSHADPRALTIMVVDDSPSVRRVNADLIQNLGWVVLQAKDGLEALEKLQASEATPDLIMLDIEMPRMDGYQFLAALRALPAFRHLPVVIVSSRSSEKHRQKAFDLGATDYLAKPYHEDEVAAVIRRLVPANDAGNL
jgi:chemosensory pili system protein ChpA (sensor histidine kinase/response regulator)